MAWACQTIASVLGTLLFETDRDLAEGNGQPFAFKPTNTSDLGPS